ncbi:MAG TPA: hypothetical protein VGB63_15730 [Pedobacter sp.]|jgi:hypothetical protein
MFDYIYFRTFIWYKGRNDTNPGLMAELVVTVLIGCLIFTLLTLGSFWLFDFPMIQKWQTLILGVLLYCGIKYRYKKTVDFKDLEVKWKNEPNHIKYKRGWGIIFLILFSMIFPILIGFLRHNLGIDI